MANTTIDFKDFLRAMAHQKFTKHDLEENDISNYSNKK